MAGRPFCIAPWVHWYVSSTGTPGLCCAEDFSDRVTSDDATLTWWNSDQMKSVRLGMLNGTPPDSCRHCVNSTFGMTHNPAQTFNDHYVDSIDELVSRTGVDGAVDCGPISIDLRTSGCNLTCRMCGPFASTAWAKLIPANKFKTPDITGLDISQLKSVYWAGGEPVMSPIHWQVMEQLIASNNTNITLSYNTNCTFPSDVVLKRFISAISTFSNVRLNISLDSINVADNNYIRQGSDTATILRNLDIIRRSVPHVEIMIDSTATSVGLLTVHDTINWSINNELNFNLRYPLLPANHYMSPNVLLPTTFEECMNRIQCTTLPTRYELIDLMRTNYVPTVPNWNILQRDEALMQTPDWFDQRMAGLVMISH